MRFPVLAVSLVLLFNAGCGSGPRGPGGFPPPEDGPRKPIMTMTAGDAFFEGTLTAEITVGPGPQPARGGPGGGGERGGPPGDGGGGGGGMRMGGGPGGGGPGGGGGPEGYGQARSSLRESNQPPATINLRLTNRGTAPVTVEVYEFNSLMGNFAVRPTRITIAPGAASEVDPMTTRLGITGDEIPVIVELRAGGRADRKTLTLRFAPANPSTPPARTP